MKRKWVIGGLVFLALLWAGNIYYFQKYSLSKPLFLKHYYNVHDAGDSIRFELYYLVSNQDADKSVTIRLPDTTHSIALHTTDVKQYTYNMHTLKKVFVDISKRDNPLLGNLDDFAFSEVLVQFSGAEYLTPIGNIRIDLRPFDKTTTILPVQSGHGNGPDGSTDMAVFQADTPLSLQTIHFPMADMIVQQAGQIEVQFNGQGWKNWTEVKQNWPHLQTDISQPLRIEYRSKGKPGYMYTDIGSLEFSKPDGSSMTGPFGFHSDPPYDERDILQIVKEAAR